MINVLATIDDVDTAERVDLYVEHGKLLGRRPNGRVYDLNLPPFTSEAEAIDGIETMYGPDGTCGDRHLFWSDEARAARDIAAKMRASLAEEPEQ